MDNRIHNAHIADLLQTRPSASPAARVADTAAPTQDFQSILRDRLKVSGHAQTRLQSRSIDLDAAKWQRVMDGVDRAAAKGARESLILVDDVALVVSVRNRTVITAVDKERLQENVFTNIDSAVFV